MKNSKFPTDSLNIHTELIMPGHTNPLGNLMGGNLLSWMDVCAGISAIKHFVELDGRGMRNKRT